MTKQTGFDAEELIAEIDKILPILDRIDEIINEDQCIFEKGMWNFYNRRVDRLRDCALRLKTLFHDEGDMRE